MQNFKVGQLLYLIQPQKMSVVPVQVSEEIIKRNIAGEQIVYNVSVPGTDTVLELNKFDGEIFDSLEKVRSYLINNAKKSIDSIIENTENIVRESFENVYEAPTIAQVSEVLDSNYTEMSGEVIEVDLGNGQVAKFTDPEKTAAPKPRKRGRPRKESKK